MRFIRYVIAAFVVLTFSLAYGQEATKQETKPEATKGAPEHQMKEKRFVATVGSDGVQHVEITGGEYYFDPNVIVVKVNVPVEFKVKKAAGYVPHDIVADSPDAGIKFKADLSNKEPAVIKFTPTKAGKYPMYCDRRFLFFKTHRERGMEGVIEVVE